MDTDENQALALVEERLRVRFPAVDTETIASTVTMFRKEYDGRPIRAFVPVLVERDAVEHLVRMPGQRVPDASKLTG